MGSWGVKLYQNDDALDIKEIYKSEIKKGTDNKEVTNKLINMFKSTIEDEEEVPIFWCVLADLQWNLGKLLPEVKEKAIYYIEKGGDLSLWGAEESKEYKARKKVLDELYEKLQSPQPPEKIIRIPKPFQTDWKNGDVFCYKIQDNEQYKNKYIVIVKVKTINYIDENKYPIIYIYNKIFDNIPDINGLKHIKYLPQFYNPIVYKEKKDIIYKCTLMMNSRYSKSVREFKFLGSLKKIDLPKNEIKDEIEQNNYYLGYIKDFEERQIQSYNAWKNIEY